MVREARGDPSKFVAEEVVGAMFGVMLLPAIGLGGVIVASFLFGFTSLLGGPFVFAKVLFWIFLSIGASLFLVLYPIIRFVRRTVRHGAKKIEDSFQKQAGAVSWRRENIE